MPYDEFFGLFYSGFSYKTCKLLAYGCNLKSAVRQRLLISSLKVNLLPIVIPSNTA